MRNCGIKLQTKEGRKLPFLQAGVCGCHVKPNQVWKLPKQPLTGQLAVVTKQRIAKLVLCLPRRLVGGRVGRDAIDLVALHGGGTNATGHMEPGVGVGELLTLCLMPLPAQK